MIKKFYKIIFIALLSFNASGCRWFTSASTTYYSWTNFKIPEGTPTFQQGFKDGCSSVLYARGNDFYHSRYKYRYDPTLIGNSEYRFGHQRGYGWCFQTILSAVTGPYGAPDKFLSLYGNAAVFDPKPGTINKTGLFGDTGNESAFSSSLTTPGAGIDAMFGVFQKDNGEGGVGGGGSNTVFGGNPLWAGGSKGYFLGWDE
ncbi:MAG: hypothetical protein SFV53_02890 [Rickettsiales bacterium]|nr:hypothetical protein [Rickettsiales bacterium]